MKLSEKQQQRISRYLREVRARLVQVPEEERQEAVSRLAARIRREIEQSGEMPPTDKAVDEVLKTCGSPGSQAAVVLGKDVKREEAIVSESDRIWLGVCAGLAQRFDLPPFALRGVALVLGLILPLLPFVLIMYLGLFFLGYAQADPEERAAIAVPLVLKDAGKAFGVAVGLFVGAKALLWFIAFAHKQLFDRTLSYADGTFTDQWGWLLRDNTTLFIWALLFSLPLAVLAALPVPAAWHRTLRKVWQAALALYAVAICFGLASIIVGIVMGAAEDLGGPGGLQLLEDVLRM